MPRKADEMQELEMLVNVLTQQRNTALDAYARECVGNAVLRRRIADLENQLKRGQDVPRDDPEEKPTPLKAVPPKGQQEAL